MKRLGWMALGMLLGMSLWSYVGPDQTDLSGMTIGKLEYKTLDRLTFGEDHILFIGDTGAASIYAVSIGEALAKSVENFILEGIDEKLATMLGTTPKEIYIRDLAVHQASQQAFLAIRRGSGDDATHHLFKASYDGKLTPVSLDKVAHAVYALSNVPSVDAVGRRDRKMRPYAISSMGYANKTLFVAGLSNEAFTSTVRKIPFPFNGTEVAGTTEIYHVAHERYETTAPVTSLTPWSWNDEALLVAGYTCTPLVTFPQASFQDGKQVKGKTVAELGAGNTPVDICAFNFDGKPYFLVANNRRALMKIEATDVMNQSALTTPLDTTWDTKGVKFIALPGSPVEHMDALNDGGFLLVRRDGRGVLNLETLTKKRIFGIWD